MSFAYSVAIKLTVANLASQGLKLLTGDLLAAQGAATKLEEKLAALKMTAIGFGLDHVGKKMVGFLEKSIDASKEYTTQLSLMNAAGISQLEIANATAAAWSTSRDVLTTTAADNLKAIRELRSVFGVDRMDEAYSILPTVQRTAGILEALSGKKQENVAFDMVKAIEMRSPGLMTAEGMQKNADLMARSIMAFGGTLNVNDFHMAMKQLKTMAFGFNDQFIYDYLPTFIQEAKTKGGSGSSAATALRTMMNSMIAGVGITKASLPTWIDMGLIKSSDVVKNATGQYQLKPGAMKDSGLLAENPLKWAEKHAKEISAYSVRHHLSLLETVDAMFKNTNSQWAMYTLLAKAPQFERDRKLVESGGTSIETYQKLQQTNPQLAEQALHAQWQNVLSILGYQVLPRLIPYMVKFANALDNVSQWMAKHPDLTKDLVIGLGTLAVSFSVIGKVLMTAGMIKFLGIGPVIMAALTPLGLAAVAITALGVAAYEMYKHWAWIEEKLGLGEKWEGSVGHYGGPNADWNGSVGHYGGSKPGSAAHATDSKVITGSVHHHHVVVHVHNKVDEHGLTTIVKRGLAKAVSAPQTGVSGFDGKQGLAPSGASGAW